MKIQVTMRSYMPDIVEADLIHIKDGMVILYKKEKGFWGGHHVVAMFAASEVLSVGTLEKKDGIP